MRLVARSRKERSIEELQNLGDGYGVLGLCARLGLDPRKGMSNTVPDWSARVETFGANTFEDVVRMMMIGRANEALVLRARLMSEGSCCGGSGVRPLLPSPSEVADAPR